MSPISAVRPFVPVDITALQNVTQDRAAGPGGISAEQFDKLAAAIETSGVHGASAASLQPTSGFESVLGTMVREVQAKQASANMAMTGLLSGQGVPLHEAVMASEEASVSFQLMVEVRNKLLESYQELMRMQV